LLQRPNESPDARSRTPEHFTLSAIAGSKKGLYNLPCSRGNYSFKIACTIHHDDCKDK
jgi:hypothetical protein